MNIVVRVGDQMLPSAAARSALACSKQSLLKLVASVLLKHPRPIQVSGFVELDTDCEPSEGNSFVVVKREPPANRLGMIDIRRGANEAKRVKLIQRLNDFLIGAIHFSDFICHLTGSHGKPYTCSRRGKMSIKKSILHLEALRFAAAGIPVFPCIANGKDPASTHGFHDATTDVEQINSWWLDNPNYNIAFSPHSVGLGVVDLDGPEADAAWEKLTEQHNIPPSREIITPRGGRHIYFQGELPMTAWRPGNKRCLGVHIDTRGVGSYVLLPPSLVNGKPYRVIHDREIAPVPEWMQHQLRKREVERAATTTDLDLPGSVARARVALKNYVARGDVAISGRGGNNRTYQLACELSDLGLSPEKSCELIEEIWNPHCQPPWTHDELIMSEHSIIRNAASYVQNERGAYAVAPASDVFTQATLDRSLSEVSKLPEPARSRFYFEDDEEQDQAPDPEWLIPDLIPDRATVLWLGKKGSFKSFLVEDLMLAVAANQKTFGQTPVRHGPTFYGAHEGRNEIKKPRKNAWKLTHGMDTTDRLPFYTARAPHVAYPEQCEEFREQIRVRLRQGSAKIGAIVLDTVAKCMMGLNENDAKDVGIFTGFCDSLRDEFDCPVIVQHHLGKDGERGSRGSSALPANFDTVITTTRHEKSWIVSVVVDNHKDYSEPEEPFTFEGKKVGSSLVFFPTTPEEHRVNTAGDEVFDGRAIGAALKALDAFGMKNAVTASVLAAELTPRHADEDVTVHHDRVNRTARAIGKLARSSLKAYVEKSGRDLMWLLPTRD